jgi:hypothetical protein
VELNQQGRARSGEGHGRKAPQCATNRAEGGRRRPGQERGKGEWNTVEEDGGQGSNGARARREVEKC